MQDWYLIRTKAAGEKIAEERLQSVVERTLLPLGKMQVRQRDRTFQRIGPIFPSYVFAFFSLAHVARQIRYTPGVREIVRFGEQAAVVPGAVIDELTSRCACGPVDFSKPAFSQGTPLRIVGGAFHKFDGLFDGYLSGTERIVVLLQLMNAERRVSMPASMVIPAE